ncbi:hypothetical protein [Chromobacterium sphagni]|uniref:Carboxypeptidase regulatory-like domain-containing protein n=1 Tax=Chromobacterium sphagni TaxID=1903179 RepID=A0A1S1WVX6_9NEIS|nr:hypothetical protein [Chromobacterium sphagni]OHX11267.1 hypothetical protein BI347_16345 [Chromobacterium sphagni]OHX16727.1 hypothetical protein BI344_21135 [Chromobacterium sphagni]
MRRLLLGICIVLLAGCTSMATRLNGSLTPPPGQAYAILSLTGKAFNPDSASVGLSVRDQQGRVVAEDIASLITDTVFGEEGMSPVEGKLVLLTLPPGDYTLAGVWGHWAEDGVFGSDLKIRQFKLNAPFHLNAGETVYLGQVQLEMSFLPEVKLSDERKRDFGHMRRVWKIPDLSQVAARPLAEPGK